LTVRTVSPHAAQRLEQASRAGTRPRRIDQVGVALYRLPAESTVWTVNDVRRWEIEMTTDPSREIDVEHPVAIQTRKRLGFGTGATAGSCRR
jgi:hypothetical protein